MISPTYVANNFLRKGYHENIEITPLKLQKLVYFLYREYLKRTNELLFSERFETWKWGPVVPSIYTEFSSYGSNPIKTYARDSQNNCYFVKENGVFSECLEETWETYKYFTGERLSNITHKENTAWSKAKEQKNRYLNIEDIKNEQ